MNKIEEKIKDIVDAEYFFARTCKHLSFLIHNGKVKNQFIALEQSALINTKILMNYLAANNFSEFTLEEKCKFCKISPESFSLEGAINLALEMIDVIIKYYKELINLIDLEIDKEVFNRLLNEKVEQKILLKKEKNVDHEKVKPNFIYDYCIPCVLSKI